jgi:hypothetical protein
MQVLGVLRSHASWTSMPFVLIRGSQAETLTGNHISRRSLWYDVPFCILQTASIPPGLDWRPGDMHVQ